MKQTFYILAFISIFVLMYHFWAKKSAPIPPRTPISDVLPTNAKHIQAILAPKIRVVNFMTKDSLQMTKADLLGKLNMRQHPDFVNVEAKYAAHQHFWVRQEVYQAFLNMRAKAEKEGIRLKITSAGRSFADQKGIWEAKWKARRPKFGSDEATAKNILKYSSMPGMSRHHWGTDIDLNNKNDGYWQTEKGKKEYAWLIKNAPNFGFCQTYTPKDQRRPEGYDEEKWHWSYMPLASKFLEQYKKNIQYQDIQGFSGAHTAQALQTIEKYVFGINPECP